MLQVGRTRLNVHHVNAKQDAVQACHVLVICSRCTRVCTGKCPVSSQILRESASRWAGLKLKASASLHRILSLNWEQAKKRQNEWQRARQSEIEREGKMLQTTQRNARIITLDAMADSGCNRRQGVDLKLKLIENSLRIPKRECRQQAQHDQQLQLPLTSTPSSSLSLSLLILWCQLSAFFPS